MSIGLLWIGFSPLWVFPLSNHIALTAIATVISCQIEWAVVGVL